MPMMKSFDGIASVDGAHNVNPDHSSSDANILQQASSSLSDFPKLKIVCLSDTHSQAVSIPPGDVLVFAGDLSKSGKPLEIQQAITWLASQPHRYKVVIGGNADLALDECCSGSPESFKWEGVTYLNQSSAPLLFTNKDGQKRILRVYGNPYVPRCGPDGQEAFQYEVDKDYWLDTVPPETDILVTHTPPKYILDTWDGVEEGCPSLLREVQRKRPLLHVFGHIHPAYGVKRLRWSGDDANSSPDPTTGSYSHQSQGNLVPETIFVNAACASADGTFMKNEPVSVEL